MSGKFVQTFIRSGKTGVLVRIRIQPRCSRVGPLGYFGAEESELKWGVGSPPVDGAANEELVGAVAKFFGVAKSRVELVSGEKSRSKTLFVFGMDEQEIEQKLSRG